VKNVNNLQNLLVFISLFLFFESGFSQDILEKPISLKVQDEKLSSVLKNIALQSNISFSYNPANIEDKTIDFQSKQQPLRIVLNQILPSNISYKVKGKYLILEKVVIQEYKAPKHFMVGGYIVDSRSGRRIEGVSIYEKATFASTASNQFGYYEMQLPTEQERFTLYIEKTGYQKEEIQLSRNKTGLVNVAITLNLVEKPLKKELIDFTFLPEIDSLDIQPLPDSLYKTTPSLRYRISQTKYNITIKTARFFTSTIQEIHFRNLDTTLSKKFQVSFLPTISTNRFLGGNTVTRYSFNVLVGYNQGVRMFEIGGMMNINAQDVGYAQVGGIGNIVGGNVYGVQIGGVFNRVHNSVRGIQVGGLINIVSNDFKGFQVTSTSNWNKKKTLGIQVSGFLNHTKNMEGIQVAGTFNNVSQNMYGIQASGLGNFVGGNTEGIQVASLFNWSKKNIKGIQVSGFLNRAKKIEGIQASGFINYTQKAHYALQLGVINIATDSTHQLLPIGMLSIVKNGYKRLEVSTDELQNYYLSFKTGVPLFYNIISLGTHAYNGNQNLITGYGLGTSFPMGKKFLLDINASISQIANPEKEAWLQNGLVKISLGAEYKIWKHWSVFGVSSFNQWFSETQQNFYEFYKKIPSTKISENTQNGLYTANWIGFQGGVRFVW